MKKLTYQNQSEIFEKVVTKNGKFFLVRFIIVERGGKLRGRVISCETLETLPLGVTAEGEHCLPTFSRTEPAPVTSKYFEEIISPFFNRDFLTVIKIRAPSRMLN